MKGGGGVGDIERRTCMVSVSWKGGKRWCHYMGDSNVVLSRSIVLDHPWMLEHLGNGQTVVDIAVQHLPNQINAGFREGKEGNAERVVEDLVDVVEWILLVDDGVQQDAQSPDILFLAAVRFTLKDLGGSVVYT
jgi:hypothetical protein